MKLSIGNIPFITAIDKPQRNDALVYYRKVAELKEIAIHSYEKVEDVQRKSEGFHVVTDKGDYFAGNVVIATGYYDNPNRLDAEGENLPNVFHYFKEAHPFFGKKLL